MSESKIENENRYHHGMVIREFRQKKGMTQLELADMWPRSDGGEGVSWHYVSLVEHGKRHIDSQYTLRRLCDLLHIEPWRFGLSDYDPFHPHFRPKHGRLLFDKMLDNAEL